MVDQSSNSGNKQPEGKLSQPFVKKLEKEVRYRYSGRNGKL
jgi:hypothetical protein